MRAPVQAARNIPSAGWLRPLKDRIKRREARVAVVGLGYVGLPVLLSARKAGFRVIGLETDPAKVQALKSRHSYISDIADAELDDLREGAQLTTRPKALAEADVVVICVPTPLQDQEPDLSFVRGAGRALGKVLRPGMLVILESTTYPGTTEEELAPLLEASGLVAGTDFGLAYSPERIDPGRNPEHLHTTPRVVGGVGSKSTEAAAAFYGALVDKVVTVSSPREAEMAKIIENTFRHVNIALVNELAMLAPDLGIDIWEALDAAATKPYGYMAFWPGPGVGGHCIPIDPSYLSWRVGQRRGHRVNFVEHAQEVNARMPTYVVNRIAEALNTHGKPIRRAKVLAIGVTFKANVNDVRESAPVAVLDLLRKKGATVSYHDPLVPELTLNGKRLASVKLTKSALEGADCVVILTAHDGIDFRAVVDRARLVFDTRGVTRHLSGPPPKNVVLL
jgi:UDP-N-acetyl-D-glucosamine dehydrogenase